MELPRTKFGDIDNGVLAYIDGDVVHSVSSTLPPIDSLDKDAGEVRAFEVDIPSQGKRARLYFMKHLRTRKAQRFESFWSCVRAEWIGEIPR